MRVAHAGTAAGGQYGTRHLLRVALSACVATACVLTGCTGADSSRDPAEIATVASETAERFDEAVARAMQLSRSDAAIIGVWSEAGDYVRAYGADVSAAAQFRAAQASQAVMCAVVLDLVNDGELRLERHIAKDLPRQVGIEDITYGQLCQATSGLADFSSPELVDIFTNNPARAWSDRELLAYSLAGSPLAAPGAEQHVSDTGALLLARALSAATGQAIETLLHDRVFAAAGMVDSYYPDNPLTQLDLPDDGMTGISFPAAGGVPVCTVPGEAEGETVAIDPVSAAQVSPSMLGGAGATVTTVTDLKRFYERYVAGAFGADSAALITTPSAPVAATDEGEETQPPAVDGWTFGLEKQGSLYGNSGAITGTLTAAYHDPTSAFTVVVALNNSSAGRAFVRALAFEVAAIAGSSEVTWSAEDQLAVLVERAVCQIPSEETPTEE